MSMGYGDERDEQFRENLRRGVYKLSEDQAERRWRRILRRRTKPFYFWVSGYLHCRHGVILHGDSCVQCERDKANAIEQLGD